MEFKIQQKTIVKDHVYIIDDPKKLNTIDALHAEQVSFATSSFNADQSLVTINQYTHFIIIYLLKNKKNDWQTFETCRKAGADIQAICNKHKLSAITIANLSGTASAAIHIAEGIALANYQFLK